MECRPLTIEMGAVNGVAIAYIEHTFFDWLGLFIEFVNGHVKYLWSILKIQFGWVAAAERHRSGAGWCICANF